MTQNEIYDQTQLLGQTVLTHKSAQFPQASYEELQWHLAKVWGVWAPTGVVIDSMSDQDQSPDQKRCQVCWDANPHDSDHHDLSQISEMAHLRAAIERAIEEISNN